AHDKDLATRRLDRHGRTQDTETGQVIENRLHDFFQYGRMGSGPGVALEGMGKAAQQHQAQAAESATDAHRTSPSGGQAATPQSCLRHRCASNGEGFRNLIYHLWQLCSSAI